LGSNEHRLEFSSHRRIAEWNMRVREFADAEGADILALDSRAAEDGLAAWYDPVLWHRTKQEVHPAAAHVSGDLAARLVAALRGADAPSNAWRSISTTRCGAA